MHHRSLPGHPRHHAGASSKASTKARVAALAVAATVAALAAPFSAPRPADAAAATITPTLVWSHQLDDPNGPIVLSSPAPATLDGRPAVVIGDRSGDVHGLDLATGAEEPGWPVKAGAPVDATASTTPDGSEVFVDAGDDYTAPNGQGGFEAWSPSGGSLWAVAQEQQPGSGGSSAVNASPTVATLQGRQAVVAGTLGQELDEITTDGQVAPGFPWYEGDTNGSTAAVADMYRTGTNEIVEGGDQTAGLSYNTTYRDGGVIRVISQAGNTGQSELNGGQICSYQTDQVVRSSPAVGPFLGGGAMGIVAGTGYYGPYAGAHDTNAVFGLDSACHLVWRDALDGLTSDSPALVDALGTSHLEVAEGTNVGGTQTSGSVYLLDGATGAVIWAHHDLPPVIGGITSADLGTGYQDLLVPMGTDGLYVLDGQTGATVAQLSRYVGVQDSALVTADPNGTIGITVAGFRQQGGQILGSQIDHYEVSGTDAALVHEAGAWPQFHHDAQLTGSAGDPPPVAGARCQPPITGPQGYWEVGADGGVFTFGDLPFCGSTGNMALARPIAAAAATSDGGGYWLVGSDGGVFAFGDARFYGSTGSLALTQPIVGMSVTPDGGGYWLLAADGGVFAFGDARFFGSTGSLTLAKPVVGMAPTPDGGGYWLVAADGGVFAFGDANFFGSTGAMKLTKPIVAILSDTQTQGYWLVGSDGGVFSYSAPFFGSTGGIKLTQPVVAAQPVGYGAGYRFEAADGGVFSFGAAGFYGSAGATHLAAPVIAAAGY